MKQTNPLLTEIARRHLSIPTLETRRSDSLDFHDVAVWQVEEVFAGNTGRSYTEPSRNHR